MKILHLLNTGKFSGAENVAISIIKGMQSEDYEMVYVARKGDIEKVLIENNVNYILLDKITLFSLQKLFIKEKPDVIHCHDYTMSILAGFCITKAKIISHLHNNSPWLGHYCFYSFLFLFTSCRFSKLLLVSDSIKNEYVFGNAIKNKIITIFNPVNIEQIHYKANLSKVDDKYDLIYLGRLVEQKNPQLLLEIIENFIENSNIRIAIVGDGMFKEIFENRLKDYENVHMYGFVSNPYPILKNSKILLLPSRWEGYGLVAIEALALGKPVVCSGVGGLSTIVDETCGLICKEKNEYLLEIKKLLEDEEYYIKKEKKAIIRANELDNYQEYLNNLNDIYKSV